MRSNACSLCDTEYKIIILLFDAFHIRSGTGIDAYLIAGANEQRHVYSATMDGKVYTVVEVQHVKTGKGSAFVRTKIKNVITGQVLENTFNPSDKYEAYCRAWTYRLGYPLRSRQ